MDNILMTVCCRAGSKCVKDKNIREIHGKPLFIWTLETALKWQGIPTDGSYTKTVVVSTDSKEILDAVKPLKCEVIERPSELATDTTPKFDVLRHAHSLIERRRNTRYPIIIDLDVTNPIRTIDDIANCIEKLVETDANAVVSVVKSRKSPYFNQIEPYYGFARLVKQSTVSRRQDAPQTYDMNASILVLAHEFLQTEGIASPTHTNRLAFYEMPEISAYDIDSELDFQIVELLMCLDSMNGSLQR